MRAVEANGIRLHVVESGDAEGPPVLFANSLGTDLRLWDKVMPLLPGGLHYVRFDNRGHGLSECPAGPYSIADFSADTEALIEALDLGPLIFVGLSIGGVIGQHLAARRPDLVRALAIACSAARMGEPAMWQARIAAVEENGLASIEAQVLDRWFGAAFRPTTEAALWGAMLARTPAEGYMATCAALAAADLTATTQTLRLPTLAIAGSEDGASPPALVEATAQLIPGAAFHVIPGAGHLPCVEDPAAFAALLGPFLEAHVHD
ncbi:MAG: 3-oxoadipate enol-lactonase [Pseudomonadota bacterium]